ncbi:MAG: hypothetical protein IJ619_01080 [Eubacterium sp.]|nr:hypothetical protein [Eubacterium sp.]
MGKNRKVKKRVIALILVGVMMISMARGQVFAAETIEDFVTIGGYNYTSNEGKNIQTGDACYFRDDCFMRSSYLGCQHIMELSIQAALASASMYGQKIDPLEVNFEANPNNLISMLESIGFEDVSVNDYYRKEKLENSAGVAVGHREIKVNGKTYTLLAIILRSAGYKQEWAGNFTVGDGDIHEGFKAARDEILRYTKQYIKNNGISGDIKVWIAGHSRGAAISNSLGGFFAGGGIDYFGGTVSITPEDVYCYTFATPRTVKDGLDKNTELSVAAARGGAYAYDTPGDAYTYTGGGTLDTKTDIYKGIRNFTPPYDIFTELPPSSWGFVHYGNDFLLDDGGTISVDDMKAELSSLNTYAYDDFVKGDYRDFTRYTFDLKTMQLTPDPDPSGPDNMGDFLRQRLNGLTYPAPTNKDYVDGGWEDTLKGIAGLYGMASTSFVDGVPEGKSSIITPVFAAFLAYSSERLIAEGRAANEEEAISLTFIGILEFLGEEKIDTNGFTVDDAMLILSKYIDENPDSELVNTLIHAITDGMQEGSMERMLLQNLATMFCVVNDGEEPTLEEGLLEMFRACYKGADPNSVAYTYGYNTPESVRQGMLYPLLSMVLTDVPDISNLIGEDPDTYNLDGRAPFAGFINAVIRMVNTEKDEDGNVIAPYTNINDAADRTVGFVIEDYLRDAVNVTKSQYGEAYYQDAKRHLDTLEDHIPEFRRLITYALFYTEGVPFDVENVIKTATTFVGNTAIIPPAHYAEVYLAWARAADVTSFGFSDHYIEKKEGTPANCASEGIIDQYILHDMGQSVAYTDKYLTEEATRSNTVVPKTAHEPGEKVIQNRVEATYEKDGSYDEVTYCKHCHTELERVNVVIPMLKKDTDPGDGKNASTTDKNNNQNEQKRNIVKTGDTFNVGILIILMTVSMIMIVGIVILKRREKR